jgi:MFS family permease
VLSYLFILVKQVSVYNFLFTTRLISRLLSIMQLAMLHSQLHYTLGFLLVGFLLLLLGRRLFWLFVAAAGFLAGAAAAPYILPHQSELFTLLVAVVLGIAGTLLAIFVQKLAVMIGGFVAGGYLGAVVGAPLLDGAGIAYPGAWLCFLVGGLLGALLMMIFFNWALIFLSSLEGAHMIIRGLPAIRSLPMLRHHHPILFMILAIIGIVVQAATYRRHPKTAT